jgi:hypothetical protein
MGWFTKESSSQKLKRLRREAERKPKATHRGNGGKNIQRSNPRPAGKRPRGWFF